MQYVSKSWLEIVDEEEVWRQMLLKDNNTCPKFKKTCDVICWTPYLTKCRTPDPGQLKYIAFVTKYLFSQESDQPRLYLRMQQAWKFRIAKASQSKTSDNLCNDASEKRLLM